LFNVRIEEEIVCFRCKNFEEVVCCNGKRLVKCMHGLVEPKKIVRVFCRKDRVYKELFKYKECEYFKGVFDFGYVRCGYLEEIFEEAVNDLKNLLKNRYRNVYCALQKMKYDFCCK